MSKLNAYLVNGRRILLQDESHAPRITEVPVRIVVAARSLDEAIHFASGDPSVDEVSTVFDSAALVGPLSNVDAPEEEHGDCSTGACAIGPVSQSDGSGNDR